MLVSTEGRFLFVHVQKTGGTTVDRYLREGFPEAAPNPLPIGKHAPLPRILKADPSLADHWIFGFVRDPWDRMAAWHSMILRQGRAAARGRERAEERIEKNTVWRTVLADYRDFDDFILRGMDDDRLPMLRRPQIDYLRSATRVADFVGRQESFAADLRAVCARLGIAPPAEERARNRNPSATNYRALYTAAMRDKVAEAYEPDLRAFGYAF